ncbi:hypothetical protein BN2537_387 [Streptomyces venezuelae]|nr:hypothetical protein BN2537_387 [Streptomyces venezuelae]
MPAISRRAPLPPLSLLHLPCFLFVRAALRGPDEGVSPGRSPEVR